MISQDVLEAVALGLAELEKKYGQNKNPGDLERSKSCAQAKSAIRKVILNCAINGEPQDITPIKTKKGCGWMIIDQEMKQKQFVASK